MEIIFYFVVTTTLGTVLKSCSVRKGENPWFSTSVAREKEGWVDGTMVRHFNPQAGTYFLLSSSLFASL